MNGLKHSPLHNTEHTDGDRDVGDTQKAGGGHFCFDQQHFAL